MLWRNELKFCKSRSSYEHLIKFEYRQLPSITFFFSYALFGTYTCRILETHSFLLFSLAWFHCLDILSRNFAYEFFFTVLQNKFKCGEFASISVGIMLLLELRILEIHSFPHFCLTCSDILSWNFAYDCFNALQIKFEWQKFMSIHVGVMPLLELRILEIQFSALFSYVLWHIELKFFIWLCL